MMHSAPTANAKQTGSPLTQRQWLFWFGQTQAPELPLYNMVLEIEIACRLDVARFRRAFSAMVSASDALRSVFWEVEGVPNRFVNDPGEAELSVIDLRAESDVASARALHVRKLGATQFDLTQRCFVAALMILADERAVFVFCQHHLVGDGVSIGLLYRFLAAHYEADGAQPIGVFGSAHEAFKQERAYLTSERAAADERFWAPRLKRTVPVYDFYGAKHEAEPEARVIERLTLKLDEARSRGLFELGRGQGLTAFEDVSRLAWLATVLFAYLYRITGGAEQALGTPLRNRHGRGSRNAVGCFLEVAAIQIEVLADDTFASLFERVMAELMKNLAHGQHCVTSSETRRLYDAMLHFHTEKFAPFAGADVHVTFTTGLHHIQNGPTVHSAGLGEHFALHCHDYGGSGELTLYFDFLSSSFDSDQRQRATQHFMKLFDVAVSDVTVPILSVELASLNERHDVMAFSRAKPAPFAEARSFISLFEEAVDKSPERIALYVDSRSFTYRELDQRSNALARHLLSLGIGPEVLVGVMLERSEFLLISLLAIHKACAAYVPLDPALPKARIEMVLEDAAPRLILTTQAVLSGAELTLSAEHVFVDEIATNASAQAERLTDKPTPNALAYVIFTSGSSGRPKGVMIEHGALANFLQSMAREPGLSAADHSLALTTLSFDIAALELYLPLCVGASLSLLDVETAHDPERLIAEIRERPPTLIQATPATYRMLLDAGFSGSPSLKLLCGGEPLTRELAARLLPCCGELWNMYGPTETTVWSSLDRVLPDPGYEITVGHPIDNTQIYILNEHQKLAPIGVVGEICIGGTGVARGYYGQPELTRQRFVQSPFTDEPGARLYRTGDLGRMRSDGRIECLGRTDFQVKLRGFRIELGDIESALLRFEGVSAAVVIARDDRGTEKYLSAYVVSRPNVELSARSVLSFLAAELPSYMVPSAVTFLPELPLTPSGKIDRRALPPPTMAVRTLAHDLPIDPLEVELAAAFCATLSVEAVGRDQSFFELGGQSLLAVRLVNEIRKRIDLPIHLGLIFQHPTVAGLATRMRVHNDTEDPSVIALHESSGGVPVFCICGIQLYSALARALGPKQSVYGMYVPDDEKAVAEAIRSGRPMDVQALAQSYLTEIRKIRPRGPYHLVGVSFGGLLAYEIAQQLSAEGEHVPVLGIIDTLLPRALKRRPVAWVLSHLKGALSEGPEYVRSRLRRNATGFAELVADGVEAQNVPEAEFDQRLAAYAQATRHYENEIKPYEGRAILFRAMERNDFAGYDIDPHLGWTPLIQKLRRVDVPGTHLGVLEAPNVNVLADALRHELDGGGSHETPLATRVAE